MSKDGNLLVVGHLALNKTKGKDGKWREYFGGAGFHVAMAAAEIMPEQVVLISNCGSDFPMKRLVDRGVKTGGIVVEEGLSDRYIIGENIDDSRSFKVEGEMGNRVSTVKRQVDWGKVNWVHLATAPPEIQLRWLGEIKTNGYEGKISVDSFELFILSEPKKVLEVFQKSDLVFANEVEWKGVEKERDAWLPKELILKLGGRGVRYVGEKLDINIKTKEVKEVIDTTGAGEIVAGVFLAKRLIGESQQVSLKEACRKATLKVSGFDFFGDNCGKIRLV